jgi:hypothetical protein
MKRPLPALAPGDALKTASSLVDLLVGVRTLAQTEELLRLALEEVRRRLSQG